VGGVAASDDSVRELIEKVKAASTVPQSFSVDFCQVNSPSDSVPGGELSLSSATFSGVVDAMGIPRAENGQIGNSTALKCTHRLTPERELLEVLLETPEFIEDPTRHVILTRDIAHEISEIAEPQMKNLYVGQEKTFFHNKAAYHDPSILYTHFYMGNNDTMVRYCYVDMIDRQNATVRTTDTGSYEISSVFEFLEDGTCADGDKSSPSAMFARMEVDDLHFLPRVIEYGTLDEGVSWRLKVDDYIEQNGAFYPKRGTTEMLRNGVTQNTNYYIVNEETVLLNAPIAGQDMVAPLQKGTFVYDSNVNSGFVVE